MRHWANRFIGIPYRDKGRDWHGCDCWGLVRLIMAEIYGVHLDSYTQCYATAADPRSGLKVVQAGVLDDWRCVTTPQAGDMVVLNIASRPWHCGVMIDAAHFIHAPCLDRHGRPIASELAELGGPDWKHRLNGFYRHASIV